LPVAATSRLKMTPATLPLSCCKTMAARFGVRPK
jgi:hypothetical protein